MFLIERLWIATLENRDAYGFTPIGVVTNLEDANRISNLEHVLKANYAWPLNYASEFSGSTVPRFRATKMQDLSGFELKQLLEVFIGE